MIGQINRHKNQQELPSYAVQRPSWAPVRGAPYGRARGRAGRIVPPVRRNRTLVLNNQSGATQDANHTPSPHEIYTDAQNGMSQDNPSAPTQSWVAKNDRHKQLINPAVYEKERLVRARDLENTWKLKAVQRDEREKIKLQRHLQKFSQPAADQTSNHEVIISGVPFKVANGGSRLIRTSGERLYRPWIRILINRTMFAASAQDTPKRAVVGGVTFLRSKHGNLYRSGIVKNKKSVAPMSRMSGIYDCEENSIR